MYSITIKLYKHDWKNSWEREKIGEHKFTGVDSVQATILSRIPVALLSDIYSEKNQSFFLDIH